MLVNGSGSLRPIPRRDEADVFPERIIQALYMRAVRSFTISVCERENRNERGGRWKRKLGADVPFDRKSKDGFAPTDQRQNKQSCSTHRLLRVVEAKNKCRTGGRVGM